MSAFAISPEQYERDIDRRVRPDEIRARVGEGRPTWYTLRVLEQVSEDRKKRAFEGLIKVIMIAEIESGLKIYGYPPEYDGKEATEEEAAFMDSLGFIKDPAAPENDGYFLDPFDDGDRGGSRLNAEVPVLATA
jgi:hypothetical protein